MGVRPTENNKACPRIRLAPHSWVSRRMALDSVGEAGKFIQLAGSVRIFYT